MERNQLEYSLIDLSCCLPELNGHNIVIFGAGEAGSLIGYYILKSDVSLTGVFYCDNNREKQNEALNPPVYSVEKAAKIPNTIFLIGFLRNVASKIHSVIQCLMDAGIVMDQIKIIDMEQNYIDDEWCMYMQAYMGKVSDEKLERENIGKVRAVKFLTKNFDKDEAMAFRSGGPLGAIIMQKRCLGLEFHGIRLEYPYYTDTDIREKSLPFLLVPDLMGTIEAVRENFAHDKDTIYIANDIYSAFGLYTLGKNYCLLHHAQGDLVKELTEWGYRFSYGVKEVIYKVERLAVENAYQVLFPSRGAEQFFRDSFNMALSFCTREPLYNTITDFPAPEAVEGIGEDNAAITFLSIGQMTRLKGMDKVPAFLEQFMNYTNRKLRWIVVADGVLKERVREQAEELQKRTGRLEYVNIDHKISHAQIFYLMNLCDVYIMLHRVSIFDFATLEAMYCKKPVILSDIPGNDEYNREDNIMLINDNTEWNEVAAYIEDGEQRGMKNRKVYDKYFAKEPFVERYHALLSGFVEAVERM